MTEIKQAIISYMSDKTQRHITNLSKHFGVSYKEMAVVVKEMALDGSLKRIEGCRKAMYVINIVGKEPVIHKERPFVPLKRDPWTHMRACIAARNSEKGMV